MALGVPPSVAVAAADAFSHNGRMMVPWWVGPGWLGQAACVCMEVWRMLARWWLQRAPLRRVCACVYVWHQSTLNRSRKAKGGGKAAWGQVGGC